jgi:hypothetical protein
MTKDRIEIGADTFEEQTIDEKNDFFFVKDV